MIQVEEGLVKGREVAGEGEEVREQEDKGEAEGEAEQGEGLKEEEQVHPLHVLY